MGRESFPEDVRLELRYEREEEEVRQDKSLGQGEQTVGVIRTLWPGPVYSKS